MRSRGFSGIFQTYKFVLYCVIVPCFYVFSEAGCAIEPNSDGHVDVPNTWTTIGYGAFSECTSLASITIPDSVTTIDHDAFKQCTSLVSITIPDSVTTIGWGAFFACTSLVSITIPDSVTTIGNSAFSECTSLVSVAIPDSVTTIGPWAFSACTSLVSVTIPDGVKEMGEKIFRRCANLITVNAGNNLTIIPPYAFDDCWKLESVVLGKKVAKISNGAFLRCFALKSINLPDGLFEIGNDAFQQSGLISLFIPSSVHRINRGAFSFAKELQNVTIGASQSLLFGAHVFAQNRALQTLKVMATDCIFAGDPLWNSLNVELFAFSRSTTSIVGLLHTRGVACNSTEKREGICGCAKGYENLMVESSSLFTCSPCLPGFKNDIYLSLGQCKMCTPGRYAPNAASEICTLCKEGKFGTDFLATSESSCRACSVGEYTPAPGASKCFKCPSGSACPSNGTSEYTPCDRGSFNSYQGQVRCRLCPSGRYGPKEGAAVCEGCPKGKHYNGTGAIGVSQCIDCPAGRYGDNAGLAMCSECPTGQYQSSVGQEKCKECALEGKIKTNNAAHTACVDDKNLLAKSVVELLFESHAAYYVSFSITAVFVAICSSKHYLGKKHARDNELRDPGGLGSQKLWQVVIKGALPGFSFGSEVVLLIAIFSDRRNLGIVMVLFRLLHPIATVFVAASLFGSKKIRRVVGKLLPDAASWKSSFNYDFAVKNIPITGAILLLCTCDVSLVQMLPWKKSDFYQSSNGFPHKALMRFSLGVDMLQAGVSAICTIAYLASAQAKKQDDPTNTPESHSLFALNITLSLLTLLMGMVVLCLRDRLLKQQPSDGETSETTHSHHVEPRGSAILELGGIYDSAHEQGTASFSNPLHEAKDKTIGAHEASEVSNSNDSHREAHTAESSTTTASGRSEQHSLDSELIEIERERSEWARERSEWARERSEWARERSEWEKERAALTRKQEELQCRCDDLARAMRGEGNPSAGSF